MARSDLLISLVKAGSSGDRRSFHATTEAIIAEERAKRHDVLADRLTKAIQANGNGGRMPAPSLVTAEPFSRGKDFISELVPKRRLEDLVLSALIRQEIEEFVEEQHRADVLRAHGLEPRSRVLLVGPPGTGKTTLAEAIAEAVAVSMFVVRYESMIGSYLGETAARLKRVFDYARTTPCVLFFDEFDAIGKERGDIHETGEIKRVVTSLLMQIDELPSYTIVVAATNHPELLDRAAWRRFQVRLRLPMPTEAQLADFIGIFLARFDEPTDLSSTTLARKLGKLSYAEAEQFCLDIRRRQVLAMGERALKSIVAEQLKMWVSKSRAQKITHDEEKHGGASSTSTSGS